MDTNDPHGSKTLAALAPVESARGGWPAHVAPFERLAASLSHSGQDDRLAQALQEAPEALRTSNPYFVMFHADLLVADREDALACQLYRRALSLQPSAELEREIVVRLFAALTRLGKQTAIDLMPRLASEAPFLSPYGQALWGHYRGVLHWRKGDVEAAGEAMTEVLAIPEQVDRRVAFTQFRARYALSAAAIDLAAIPQAAAHAGDLVELALRHDFRSNVLIAFVQHLNAELLDQRGVPSLESFIGVPGGAFDHASSAARFDFATSFGIRALALGQLNLAHSLFKHLVSDARRSSLHHRLAIARFWQMHVLAHQGNLEAAQANLAEIRALSAPKRFLANLWPSWASLMIQTSRLPEAQEALRRIEDEALTEDDRARVRLYQLVADVLADNEGAGPRLRRFLEGPDGEKLSYLEARLLRRVGEADTLPPLCLQLLGQPSLRVGEHVIEFPRRKVLSLLALLALHPAGLSSEELVAQLFPESEDFEPQVALRKAIYLARQLLKAAGMPDPIEHGKGRYRLCHERFALIDCLELESLHRKALECEREGHHQGARLFHQFIVWMGAAQPFDGLPEPCFVAPRERLLAIYEQSRAYLLAKEVAPTDPDLPWGEAWETIKQANPAVAQRIRALHGTWVAGDEDKMQAEIEALLIETSIGDRTVRIARGIVLVHGCMMALSREAPDALVWTERLMTHAARHPGTLDRLMVRAIRLHSRRLDENNPLSLESLLETPSDWLVSADPTALGTYLAAIGHYFIRMGQAEVASRLFAQLREGLGATPSPILEMAIALGETPRRDVRPSAVGTSRVPLVHFRWFGEPSVALAGEAIRFPRKKCLALLALLALHPQGLEVDAIFSLLYPEVRHSNAKKTIYTLVATTRQALDVKGGADLIVSVPGLYRLRTESLGSCDRFAFELVYEKACDLERLGSVETALPFFRLACDLAERGPLFEGLTEPCFEALSRVRQRQVLQAKSKV
ncbi:hypothetical protein J7643_08800 [bacterium]|nr:hypothetical protein [bacterium]